MHPRLSLLATAAALGLAVPSCTFEPAAPSDSNLAAQLHRRAFLDVSTASDIQVSATSRSGTHLDVDPDVLGGQAVLRTTDDGWLLVEDLDLPLDDVTVPAGVLHERPVTFTDLSLRLGTQLAIDPTSPLAPDDTALSGWGDADLLLDWSMVSFDGDVLPLATRRIPSAPFAVSVELDGDGTIHAALAARVDGVVDELGELVVLRDLTVDVVSARPAP